MVGKKLSPEQARIYFEERTIPTFLEELTGVREKPLPIKTSDADREKAVAAHAYEIRTLLTRQASGTLPTVPPAPARGRGRRAEAHA